MSFASRKVSQFVLNSPYTSLQLLTICSISTLTPAFIARSSTTTIVSRQGKSILTLKGKLSSFPVPAFSSVNRLALYALQFYRSSGGNSDRIKPGTNQELWPTGSVHGIICIFGRSEDGNLGRRNFRTCAVAISVALKINSVQFELVCEKQRQKNDSSLFMCHRSRKATDYGFELAFRILLSLKTPHVGHRGPPIWMR